MEKVYYCGCGCQNTLQLSTDAGYVVVCLYDDTDAHSISMSIVSEAVALSIASALTTWALKCIEDKEKRSKK